MDRRHKSGGLVPRLDADFRVAISVLYYILGKHIHSIVDIHGMSDYD